jgi:hypothetical protein
MFQWLKSTFAKKTSRVVIREDPDFGPLTFDDEREWWEGQLVGGGGPIQLTIHAGPEGPTMRQRQIWTDLRNELPSLSKRVIREF